MVCSIVSAFISTLPVWKSPLRRQAFIFKIAEVHSSLGVKHAKNLIHSIALKSVKVEQASKTYTSTHWIQNESVRSKVMDRGLTKGKEYEWKNLKSWNFWFIQVSCSGAISRWLDEKLSTKTLSVSFRFELKGTGHCKKVTAECKSSENEAAHEGTSTSFNLIMSSTFGLLLLAFPFIVRYEGDRIQGTLWSWHANELSALIFYLEQKRIRARSWSLPPFKGAFFVKRSNFMPVLVKVFLFQVKGCDCILAFVVRRDEYLV